MRSTRGASDEFTIAVVQAPEVETVADLVDTLERAGLHLAVVDDDRVALDCPGASGSGQAFAGLLGRLRAGQRSGIGVDPGGVTHLAEATQGRGPLTQSFGSQTEGPNPLAQPREPFAGPAKAPHVVTKRATLAL